MYIDRNHNDYLKIRNSTHQYQHDYADAAGPLERAVVGKIHKRIGGLDRIRPFLDQVVQRRRAGKGTSTRAPRRSASGPRAGRTATRDGVLVVRVAAGRSRKLNKKIETLEGRKRSLDEKRAGMAG